MDASQRPEQYFEPHHRQDVSLFHLRFNIFLLVTNRQIIKLITTQSDLTKTLEKWADEFGVSLQSADFATQMDLADPLRECRLNFTFPTMKDLPCGKHE